MPRHNPLYQARHYEDAAKRCAVALPSVRSAMIEVFVEMFREDNPKFNPSRFRAVASGEAWKNARRARNPSRW